MNATEIPYVLAPLAKIKRGKNYRKRRPANWDTKLDELAESVRLHGVLQPIIARPLPRGELEHVAGERRLIAAERAGLKEIPTIVKELTDDEVLDIQAVENNQREDPHPLDEAELFAELVEHGRTPQQIADRLGRDVRYVAQRLALNRLTDKCRKALDDGQIIFGVALQIARIPNAKVQDEALKELVPFRDEPPVTVKQASETIHDDFLLQLGEAPFDRADAELVEKAGACTACPKRTGNQTELFGDVKSPDVCTDRLCFKAKVAAHGELVMARAKKDGKKIITAADAKKIWPYEHSTSVRGGGYAELGGTVSDPKTYREVSVRALLKGREFDTYVARNPHNGKVHELVSSNAINAAFKARAKERGDAEEKSSRKKKGGDKAARDGYRTKAEAKETVTLALAKAVAEGFDGTIDSCEQALRFIIPREASMGDMGAEKVALRRGWLEPPKKQPKYGSGLSYGAVNKTFREGVKQLDMHGLVALLLELYVADLGEYAPKEELDIVRDVLELCGVDRKKVEARVVAELKAKQEAEKVAAKAKPAPKPKAKKAAKKKGRGK